MRTLGLVGGTSWVSTIDYYRLLNEGVNRRLGGGHYAQLLLYSFDYAEIQSFTHVKNWDGLFDRVSGVTGLLVEAGADGFVLCANTMHLIADRLQEKLDVPILHIADATAAKIEAAGLEHVALLGTRFTMEMDFFKERLARRGIRTTIPDDADRGFIHHTIFNELDRGLLLPESKSRYLKIIDALATQGVQGVILGCTEIPLLVKQPDCALPLFDTTEIHAEVAVEFALGGASPS